MEGDLPLELNSLNEPQAEAVSIIDGPLLVLAGAGSGKTRVLTYRIANIIESKAAHPWEILAITFTNKAAAEMRERLTSLIGASSRGMWVSTFHSMCVRILKSNAELLGFTRNFTIYDTDDQKRLIKTIMAEMDINPKLFQPGSIINRISMAKNELIVPLDFENDVTDPVGKVAARVYIEYQKRLKESNAMDFDDLLIYTYLLFKNHPDILQLYQDRFRYILVDEYQDTNHAQYAITQMLALKNRNIMVVGDDDQSIYSWRGADIRNILEFEQDWPDAHVVKLEQNYRSSGNILAAANKVIAGNAHRKQKKLFTEAGDGEKIGVYYATDERDEGRWIASEIERAHAKGAPYGSVAVFYRTNAQSRMLEDMLLRAGVPYRIVGGTKFFDRAEIKDVMAYLTLVVNPSDNVSFERVINVPARGIGKSTIEKIHAISVQYSMPMMQAAEMLLAEDDIRQATKNAIAGFLNSIQECGQYEGDLRQVVERIVEITGVMSALQDKGTDEAYARVENIKEFFGVVQEFTETHDDADALFDVPSLTEETEEGEEPPRQLRGDSLSDFIEWVRLRTDLDTVSQGDDAVTLMTVHSAKGLEYDSVFVAGMEESIFPHMASMMDAQGVEEERRLAYVAITRARKKLCLTCAQTRKLFGQTNANAPSRFLKDIPSELRDTKGLGSAGFSGTGWEKRGSRRGIAGSGTEAGDGRVFGQSSAGGHLSSRGQSVRRSSDSGKRAGAHEHFMKGDVIDHKTFGRGFVIKVDGDTLHVKFEKTGQVKKLLKDYAPIVKIK